MSKFVVRSTVLLCLTLVAVLSAVTTLNAQPGPEAARLDCFDHSNGSNYFALRLQPPAAPTVAAPRDVVILVSTSASQAGEYRTESFQALQSLVAGLAPGSRVRLIATDLSAIPLTKGFVAPDSAEWKEALAALNQRTPLGSNDMEKALSTAAASFGGSTNPRALVYIGDGSSRANLLKIEKFQPLAAALADQHVSVLSYGVGSRVDRQMLDLLARQTGGVLLEGAGSEVGSRLAAAAAAAVYWPTAAVKWPAGMGEVFPKALPPLRSDRDTVLIGTLKGKEPLRIEATVDGPGGVKTLTWNATPGKSMDDNGYLPSLVAEARADGGASLPLVDSASLVQLRQEIRSGGRNMTALAARALALGNLDSAERLADEALRFDPNDRKAMGIKEAVAKAREGGAPAGTPLLLPSPPEPAAAADGLNLVGAAPGVGGPAEGAAAVQFGAVRNAQAAATQTEVQNVINQARGQMRTTPENAIRDLRLEMEKVKGIAELTPEAREQFYGALQAALREGSKQLIEVEHRRQEDAERRAAGMEQALVANKLIRDQDKVKQLIARVDFLLEEARTLEGEEAYKKAGDANAAGLAAAEILPHDPAPAASVLLAQTRGYDEQNTKTTALAQRGVMDTMFACDMSRIPFNDYQPIVYPDSQWWKEMTRSRKERFGSKDMKQRGPAEKKIEAALKSPTQLEFVDTPLTDVIDYLKDYHQIEIQLDKKAMEDAGVGTDTPVTKSLKGVSLRSALRLMLAELNLKYVIKDEVLLITTTEAAENMLTTRVYSVADLVIPIRTPNFAGGFGGMGGMGGFGGQGGGFGGAMNGGGGMGGINGMQGFGGGQGGQGMGMGGGMGFQSVPAEILPQVPVQGPVAWAVEEEKIPAVPVPANVKAAPVKADAAKAPADAAKPATIPLAEMLAAADPKAAWEHYFATHQPQPAAVREAVANLTTHQKFEHVIALIEAALRHQQHQSWMFEALGLTMQAANRPKDEIERAVMSAAEFVRQQQRPDAPGRLHDAVGTGPAGDENLPPGCRPGAPLAAALPLRAEGGRSDPRPGRHRVDHLRHPQPGLALQPAGRSGRPPGTSPKPP